MNAKRDKGTNKKETQVNRKRKIKIRVTKKKEGFL